MPVVNLYKYEEERYRSSVVRFLSFKNDKEHKLGRTPIPGGVLKVYRAADAQEHLSYAGQSSFKYIPVDEDVELNLGRGLGHRGRADADGGTGPTTTASTAIATSPAGTRFGPLKSR